MNRKKDVSLHTCVIFRGNSGPNMHVGSATRQFSHISTCVVNVLVEMANITDKEEGCLLYYVIINLKWPSSVT